MINLIKTIVPSVKSICVASATSMLIMSATFAQAEYPERTIRVVIPFGQGGATDTVGRMVSNPLEDIFGQSVVITNQPGAGGAVGLSTALRARPDGYTIAIGSDSSLAARPLMTESGYTLESMAPVARIVESPTGFATLKGGSYNSLDALIAAGREKGRLTWSSPGVGSGPNLAAEIFFADQGIDIRHVTSNSGGEALIKVMSGEVDFASVSGSNLPAMLDQEGDEGSIQVLGLAIEDRWERLPEIPTFRESGYDFVKTQWFGFVAPAGTPEDILETLASAVESIITSPESQEMLKTFHYSPAFLNPQDFKATLDRESDDLEPVLRSIGLHKDQ